MTNSCSVQGDCRGNTLCLGSATPVHRPGTGESTAGMQVWQSNPPSKRARPDFTTDGKPSSSKRQRMVGPCHLAQCRGLHPNNMIDAKKRTYLYRQAASLSLQTLIQWILHLSPCWTMTPVPVAIPEGSEGLGWCKCVAGG